jgi:hypothetical protein
MFIHITGASGSGTSTLGKALAGEVEGAFLDADDFFWSPSDPPFKVQRPADERRSLLLTELSRAIRGPKPCKAAGLLSARSCPVLNLEGDLSTQERLARIRLWMGDHRLQRERP